MIDVDRLQEALQRIFHDELFLEVASPQTDLFEEGILDSLTFVELLVRLESNWGVKVSLETLDTDKFRTLERIARFVRESGA